MCLDFWWGLLNKISKIIGNAIGHTGRLYVSWCRSKVDEVFSLKKRNTACGNLISKNLKKRKDHMANPKIQLADKKTIRNISLFILIALASGWLGRWIDTMVEPAPEGESPGMGIWLVLPLLTTILLRLFAGDGWKDIGLKPNFKGNGRWYFLSLIIFPVVTAAVLIIGNMVGWISFSNFRTGVYLARIHRYPGRQLCQEHL